MNNYQGPGGGWNVSPQAYHHRRQRKAQKYQARHGLKPKRIRPSRFSRILGAPFRLIGFLLKVALFVAVIAAIVVGLMALAGYS